MKPIHLLSTLPFLPFLHAAPSNPPLRGSTDLLGYDPSYPLPSQAPDLKYTLVPGQKDDAAVGTYLDFEGEDVDSPQPIRGTKGGTDPGPSMFV